jgi:hypothetical protein
METLSSILNNALYVTILVILISSVVGFYAKAKSRDRCLRDLHGFRTTVETKEGEVAWGTLRVYGSGIELLYASTYQDVQGHVENSYILYASELANLKAIYRFYDHQSEENRRRRERDIRHTYQPSLFKRLARALRNLFSAFKDAIVQTLNTILGYRAAQRPENLVLSQYKELTASGAQWLSGAVGNAYEPILERHIGQYVVLEILRGSKVEEEHGILKEYSANYIELLNVKLEVPLRIYLQDRPSSAPSPVHVERVGNAMRVTHDLDRQVDVKVGPGQSADVELLEKEMQATDALIELQFGVRCLADLIVPRTISVVRHAGERKEISLDALLGLDGLTDLPWIKRLIGARRVNRIERR